LSFGKCIVFVETRVADVLRSRTNKPWLLF